MFSFFKKRKQNFIELGIGSYDVPKDYQKKFIEDIIVPCKNFLPTWFKTQRPEETIKFYNKGGSSNHQPRNTKYCPAFIDLFKNSYAIKSPCDWYLETNTQNGYKFESSSPDVLKAHNHNIVKQMNGFGNGNIFNLKLEIDIRIRSTKNLTKLLFLPPYYYNPTFPLTLLSGTLPLLPYPSAALNVNYTYSKTQKIQHYCKKGDVIALLYSVSNKIYPIKTSFGNYTYNDHKFLGSYIHYLKKWNWTKN